jgi:hypothetical protein
MALRQAVKRGIRSAAVRVIWPRTAPEPTPPPPQAGHIPAPPDFVGVGAMKAGTTWWHSLIDAHPAVVGGRRKELHFFDLFGEREFTDVDRETYAAFFARPPGAFAGEWTPRYMFDVWTPPLLRRAAPDAKLLVLLRDPIERFVSGVAHDSRTRRVVGKLAMENHFSRGLYYEQLAWLLEHFPRERLLVLQFERCIQDPRAELARTFEFLGIEPTTFVPGFEGNRATTTIEKPSVPDHVLSALRARYQDDMSRLFAAFPELDPELWATTARPV